MSFEVGDALRELEILHVSCFYHVYPDHVILNSKPLASVRD